MSIVCQTYPNHLIETFVCDGMSTDSTQEIIREFSTHNPRFHLLVNAHKTTPHALNLGIKKSTSDIVIILGAHSELDKDFVLKSVSSFDVDPTIMCTGGILENEYENISSKIIGAAMSSSFGVGNAHFRTGAKNGFVDTVAFGAYKKEIFDKVGLFDEDLIRNQDDEFNYRITSNGYKIYLNSEIKCKYFVRASFQKLFRQYYQYGYWKVFVNKKHKAVTTVRQIIPMMFVLFLWLLIVSPFFGKNIFLLFCIVAIAYLLLAFVFAIKKASSFKFVFGIISSFFILHTSYGFGYLKGIVDFLILGKSIKKQETLTR